MDYEHRLVTGKRGKVRDCEFCRRKTSKEVKNMKRTLEGTNRKRKRTSGFRARMRNPDGQNVISARRRKGRHRLAV